MEPKPPAPTLPQAVSPAARPAAPVAPPPAARPAATPVGTLPVAKAGPPTPAMAAGAVGAKPVAPAPTRPAVPSQPVAKPAAAAPAAKPATAVPVRPPSSDGPVLEEPSHPFEEFLAGEFNRLVANMNKEGQRLKVPPMTQVKVLVNMLTVRVAAFGVRASLSRADILKVLDYFWGLQPKPPAPPPQPKPPAGR